MVSKSPKDRVVGPLPNGRTSWLINGGDPNHLHPLGWPSKYSLYSLVEPVPFFWSVEIQLVSRCRHLRQALYTILCWRPPMFPCSGHLMGPILEEWTLIQIYWTLSLIIMHCLGWCHIMGPPVQSLPLQNHPFENLWTKNGEICGSHLQVFGKVLKINKNNENQKNKNLTSEVLWSDSFCPLSWCPCGLRDFFQKKRKRQCTGTHY